jgi:hypothetical protein
MIHATRKVNRFSALPEKVDHFDPLELGAVSLAGVTSPLRSLGRWDTLDSIRDRRQALVTWALERWSLPATAESPKGSVQENFPEDADADEELV